MSCFYHDSSACLIQDGILTCAIQEERITRKKHDNSFPINAIKECLKIGGITIKDVSYIAFYEKPLLKFERLLYQHIDSFPKSWYVFIKSTPSWIKEKLRVRKIMKKKLKYKGAVIYIPHHLAHASSYLISPFTNANILTWDGVGEFTTTAYGYGVGNDIILSKDISFPHSIGLLYSTITAYLGFSVNNSEYKVMGLSAYGNPDAYYEKLKNVIDIKDDGSFRLDMDYFVFHYKEAMSSKKLCKLLGGDIRKPESEVTQRHKDIAAALQKITEEILIKMLNHIYKERPCENLIIGGGCGLNSVANGKIISNTPYKHIWIQPDSGDGGTSVGAGFYLYNTLLKNKREYVMDNAYLGQSYTDEEIEQFLKNNKITYTKFKDEEEKTEATANIIFDNKVVGWFQGKMEWGPRALGNRSILSNATNPQMKEILNLKVKHRERFRPFAPVVCKDDAKDYFICDEPFQKPTDFMLMVYPIKKDKQSLIPAVTHVDGSGRLQTISWQDNPSYYYLIKRFGKLSGVPILINTSFNIRGEPIVCSPNDAYKCMMGTEIDALVIGNYLVYRKDNMKDAWDGEKNARD